MAGTYAALDDDVDAVKLDDAYDSNGRRVTAVDELIDETIAGDARLATLAASYEAAGVDTWTAVARDLARQVIDAETEFAGLAEEDENLDAIFTYRELWRAKYLEEEQAHCDTYIEAVRLSEELAGWQDSDAAEYRKSTAGARLEDYLKAPAHTP